MFKGAMINMRKHLGLNRIGALALSAMMAVSLIPAGSISAMASDSDTAQQVSLEIDSDSKAEIALAVGNTKVDYSEFEKELKEALKNNHGISEDRVDFVEVDGTASSSTSDFAWWKYDHVPSSKSDNISDTSHIYYEKNAGSSNNEGDLKYTSSSSKYHAAGGNHIYSPSSNSMTFNGYGSYAYKDFYYLPNTQSTKKTIEFTLSEAPYDALDGVGFFVNTSMTGSYKNHTQVINGYLVFFQYSGAMGNTIKIFSLSNVNAYQFHHSVNTTDLSRITTAGSSTFGGNIKLIATSTAYASTQKNMYRKVKIEIMPTYIQLWLASGTSSSVYNATLGSSNMVTWNDSATGTAYKQYPLTAGYDNDITYRGGFGPLISYQSHGCSDITSLTLSNLKMDSEYVRSLTEVIRSTNWSDDKQSFLVNLNEDEISDFSSEYTTGEIINRLNDDDITYIGWCGSRNFDASKVFVDGVGNGSGLVNINSSSMITGSNTYSKQSRALQVEAIATLIANKLATVSQGSEHVFLTTDNFSFKSTGATLYDGNWSVGYSKTSYDDAHNNISTYQDLSTASFAIAGYYEIYYNGMTDTPKARIRIHEAPVAQFVAKAGDDGSITINNKSYDPEFCTDVSNASGSVADGIKETVIEYRNLSLSSPEWTTTAPSNIGTDTWMIRMTVTDADGASAVAVQQIKKSGSSSTTVAPYGTFELSSSQYIKGISDNVSITDKSYSPDGTTGFTVYYTIKNSSGSIVYSAGKGTSNSFAPASTHTIALSKFNEGTYTVTMHAISADGTKTSADVSRTFKVVQGYKVTYDANTGDSSVTGMPSEQYKIKGQDLVISKSAPSRTGYTFAGWSTQSTGTTVSYEPRATYKADQSVTLYAVWLKNMTWNVSGYTGTYDGAYHGLNVTVTDPSAGYTVKYGSSEGNLSTTVLTYKNAGTYNIYYSIYKNGYQTVSSMRTVTIGRADASITLSDKSVSYDGNAHGIDAADVKGISSSDKPSGSVTYKYYVDKNCTELTTNANSGAASEGAAPVNAGTYYVKAYTAQDVNYNAAESNTARLSILKYKVNFYNDGIGTETEPYTGIVAGNRINAPKAPTDEIYYFMGWYKEASLTTLWNFDSDVVTDDVTLYAKWQKKSTFETHWTDENGDDRYGSLDDAIDAANDKKSKNPDSRPSFDIQNDVLIDDDVILPEGTDINIVSPGKLDVAPGGHLTIPENTALDIKEGGSFKTEEGGTVDNNGSVDNNGNFENNGRIDNNGSGTIGGTSPVNNNGEVNNDGVISAPVNNGSEGQLNADAEWSDADGNKYSGSLDKAIENVPQGGTIIIKNDPEIDSPVKLPDGTKLEVPEGGKLTIKEGGSLDIPGNSVFNNDGIVDNNGEFTNEGEFNNNSEFENNGSFNNGGNMNNAGDVDNEGGFNNTGTVNNEDEGRIYGESPIGNSGTIDNDGIVKSEINNSGDGKVEAEAEWTDKDGRKNSGSFTNAVKNVPPEGTITIKDDPHVDAPVTIPDNVTVEVPEGGHFTIEEGGSLDIPEGSEFKNDGTVDNKGTIKNDGTFDNDGNVNNNGQVDNDGTFDNSGDVKNDGGFDNTGDFNNKPDGKVEGKKPIDNEGTIDNDGSIKAPVDNKEGGKLEAEAEWTDKDGNKTTGSLKEAIKDAPKGSTILIKDDPYIEGTVKIPEGVTIEVPEGSHFTIEEGGSLDIPEGSEFKNDGTVDNKGTIKNDGTFDNSGDVKNDGNFNNTGDFNNKPEGKVEGKKPIDNEGTIDNDGSIKAPVENKEGGKLEAEAEWIDKDGNKCTGSFEEAVKNVPAGGTITIREDVTINHPVKVPDNVTIEIPKGTKVTIEKGGSLEIPKDSAIKGDGDIDNKGSIKSDGVIAIGGKVDGKDGITGGGTVDEAVIKIPISKDNDRPVDKSFIGKLGDGTVTFIIESLDKNNSADGDIIAGVKLESAYKAIKSVVGEEGIKRIEAGEDMFLRLVLVRVADKVTESDKVLMEQFTGNFADKDGICKIGEFIDLSFQIKNGNSPWQKIKVLGDELEITIKIPDNLLGKEKYYILRSHDGVCDMLEDLDTDSSTITFRTDRFSTYAIVYVDNDVKTGDNATAPFMLYAMLMAFAGLGVTITLASRKKRA